MNRPRLRNVNVQPRRKFRNNIPPVFYGIVERNDKPTVKTTLKSVYKEFVNESSIHGIKYIVLAKTRFERIFWILVLIVSFFIAVQLANKFYARHQEGNMRTLVIDNHYPAWKIPVPAITICHPNLVSRSRVSAFLASNKNLKLPAGLTVDDFINSLSHLREVFHPTNNYADHLDKLHEILVLNNISLKGLLKITSPSCDYIVACRYEGKMQNCKSLLKRSLMSSGYCCSFNYEYNNNPTRQKEKPPLFTFNNGKRFIISIMLRGVSPIDRISSDFSGDGFKVVIHNSYGYPGSAAQQFVASTGNEVIVRLYPRRLTSSAEVLNSLPHERKCEKKLVDNIPYKLGNCLVKCRENLIRKSCGCVPFYASRILPNYTICNLLKTGCLARSKMELLALNPNSPACRCYPNCEEDTFNVDTTSVFMNATQLNPSAFYQVLQNRSLATAIHFTFAEQTCMLQRREIVLSWINLISSLGGVFSLFLGCSFISLIELIYFIGYFMWKISSKPRNPRKTFQARPRLTFK